MEMSLCRDKQLDAEDSRLSASRLKTSERNVQHSQIA